MRGDEKRDEKRDGDEMQTKREKKKKDRRDERRFDFVEKSVKTKKSAGRILCSKVQNLILFSCLYLVRIRISGLRELIQNQSRCA